MTDSYKPTAIYFHDSDCVEYTQQDALVIYDRIDDFLTLINDAQGEALVGFKLKGFKNIFTTQLQPAYRLNEKQFINLVSAIEAIIRVIGDDLFADEDRVAAYRSANQLAETDQVQLFETDLAA